MPQLRPFHGIRYSSSGDLEDLVCPPYDVISLEHQVELHQRHPANAVHLELARGEVEKYREVARTFERWLEEGMLRWDQRASLYAYRQDFRGEDGTAHRVAGVIGALELEELGRQSGVLPHERTMPGPIEDRLALMRACPVNISPIYTIYRGGGSLAPFFDSLSERPATARFQDRDGTLHRLWVVDAAAEIETVADAVASGPLVIADGHHRYETALAYHKEQDGRPGGHDAVMCFCVDADVEDLVVLPYHRALRADVAPDALAARLRASFRTKPVLGEPVERVEASDADHPFVFVFSDEALLVEVDAPTVAAVMDDHAAAWSALDVVALHEAVLHAVLPGGAREMRFSKDAAEINRLVTDEGWTAGVLLKPMDPVQVVEVARSGERMPQKASYFWPKALTGLVFRSLRPDPAA